MPAVDFTKLECTSVRDFTNQIYHALSAPMQAKFLNRFHHIRRFLVAAQAAAPEEPKAAETAKSTPDDAA